MKIVDIVCSAGRTGFYFDDQAAIKAGAGHDGMAYIGKPLTEGFTSIRQTGESISVMIILEDGQVAYGDCAAVQYSGAGGRDPLFLAADFIPVIEKDIAPKLIGRDVSSFKTHRQMDCLRGCGDERDGRFSDRRRMRRAAGILLL